MKTLAIILASCFCAFGQTNLTFETLTIGQKTYTNCTLKTINAAQGIVLYPGGGSRISLADLPADVQSKIGFSTDSAQSFESDQQKQKADQIKRVKAAQAAM